MRPCDERDAFEGLVIPALEFQHGGRTGKPASESLSARISVRAQKNVKIRCRQFVQRAKSVRRVTAANGRSAEKVSKVLEEVYNFGNENPCRNKGKGPLGVKPERIAIP